MNVKYKLSLLIVFAFTFSVTSSAQSLPEGFNREIVYTQIDNPGGILLTDSSFSFVWELGGKVWLIKNGEIFPTPVIDITEEVAFWWDLGMIGAALDPDFLTNGYIYLYYNVDRHYLRNYGTPDYDPTISEVYTPTMGRITRYTLNTVDFQFAIPDSRHILLGDSIGNGIALCAPSHGVGALVFGEDGSLLVSAGDGSTWASAGNNLGYNGTGPLPEAAYDSLALSDGIISENEFIGSFRAQYLDGLNGKILRINPQTGEGLPGNPFYDASIPEGNRSKIWALGLRNPYRFTVKPGTGFGSLDGGFPGVLVISDVGDWLFEEINIADAPGLNFGWPLFQGPIKHDYFWDNFTQNTNAPNPLYDGGACTNPFFNYQSTVIQPNASHTYTFPNECNSGLTIPTDVTTFVHSRPTVSYANIWNWQFPFTVTSTFDDQGEASFCTLEGNTCGVEGDGFIGMSSSGGAFLTGDKIPNEYKGWYLHIDYSGWLRAIKFNEFSEPEKIEFWADDMENLVNIYFSEKEGCAYITSIWPTEISRVCFGGNLKPVVQVTPDLVYGYAPLQVDFTTDGTYDPEGDPLSYFWDFGDGVTSTAENPTHTFQSVNPEPVNYQVTLTVSDTSDGQTVVSIPVSLNNTPPVAEIVSIEEGALYAIGEPSDLSLIAVATDEQSEPDNLNYTWEIRLNHNTHFHVMNTVTGNDLTIEIEPTGCSETETYWYEVVLTVTDPQGLSATDSKEIYPDCDNSLVTKPLPADHQYILLPNPASDVIEVRSSIPFGDNFHFEVYDYQGKKLTDETSHIAHGRNFVQIDISKLPADYYVTKIELSTGWVSLPFIKVSN
jgi:glucose/arabinose dehydrogenase